MSEIKIQYLSTQNVSGMNLLDDSENFLMELSIEDEANILYQFSMKLHLIKRM
jgi:hypothetical protein